MTQTETGADAFDVIIVGAGSAGCVLANRLSADPRRSVLLIEAGGETDTFLVNMPKGIGKLVTDPKFMWNYPVNQERMQGVPAQETWQRGKGLGGSSSVNGMIWSRGQPSDYDFWAGQAGDAWGWRDMKRCFRAIEDHALGDDGVRGVGGAVGVTPNGLRYPLCEKAISAGLEMGLPLHRDDLNREDLEGVGYYCYNIRGGRRESAAKAFLEPVRRRPNLTVLTGGEVSRVLFEDRRASGIRCRIGGVERDISARGEVILSAGCINSPKLLQVSGIGPASLLHGLGIDVVQDSPDCGRRIREHLGLMLTWRLKGDRGIAHRLHGFGLGVSALQYLATRTGPLANGAMEVGAFVKTRPELPHPDLQLYVSGWMLHVPEDRSVVAPMQSVEPFPAMTVTAQLLQLTSEGELDITGTDHAAPLAIRPNWLSTDGDRQAVIDLVRYVRRLVSQPSLAPYVEREVSPGPHVQTDDEILETAFRTALCGTHAVGSCRMGLDKRSVVDERLRVRGVAGLRVVDCSVMPGLISGNTNAPAMALAWRAADLILAEPGLSIPSA
jgi:choline dehydrogenase-like flavoprotein